MNEVYDAPVRLGAQLISHQLVGARCMGRRTRKFSDQFNAWRALFAKAVG